MQDLDVSWKAHLALNVTQICHCLKIEKGDISLYLTDHDRPLLFLEDGYFPDENLTIAPAKFYRNLRDDQFEISSFIDDNGLSYDLIEADHLQDAQFYLYQVNWGKPDEYNLLKIGVVGDVYLEAAHVKLAMHGIAKPLEKRHNRLLQEKCDAQFAGDRCNIDTELAIYHKLGQVSLLKTTHSFEIELPSGVDSGYFDGGSLEWQSGENINVGAEKLRIMRQFKLSDCIHSIILYRTAKYPIALEDELKLTVGCDKSFATCRDRFANSAEFRGFDQMPGKAFKFTYPQRISPENLV
ncbi:MAG: DUF2163 domain-containing protein [Alphaproteobacteria bacterium]|nr:DUF2163 domain-containing protein [Alphaproteobacteria bacterium]